MIRTVTNTTFTLGIISLLNFSLVAIVSNFLGKEGVAEMGLIVLGISFILMINNVVGGSSMVYLSSRKSIFTLLIISYGWALFSTGFMGIILYWFALVPIDYIEWILIIGFFECIFSIHNQFFIGKEMMKSHNFLKLIQKVSQVVLFLLIAISIQNFVFSLFLSYLIVLVLSVTHISKIVTDFRLEAPGKTFKVAFNYGLQIQASNIVQLLNYRLLYFFIEKTMGSVLGIFIVAVQLSESLWIPSKALAIIQYGKVANEEKNKEHNMISFLFLKLSVVITLFLLIVLLLIPESWILQLFGKDISGTKPIILGLSLGVMSIAIAQTFSHYLSGKGKYSYLVKSALLGLLPLVLFGWWIVNEFGLVGAGVATSISYLISCIYLGNSFLKESGSSVRDFVISKEDVKSALSMVRRKKE